MWIDSLHLYAGPIQSVPAGVCKEDKNDVKAIGKHVFLFPRFNRACQSQFYGGYWGSE